MVFVRPLLGPHVGWGRVQGFGVPGSGFQSRGLGSSVLWFAFDFFSVRGPGFVRRTGFGCKFVGLRLEFSVLDFRVVSGLGGSSSSSHLDKPCMALHAKALKVTAGGCTCTS